MNEVFQRSQLIAKADLQRLQTKSNRAGIIRFSIQYVLFLAAILGIIFIQTKWLLGVNIFIYALLLGSLFAPLHECSHYTAFQTRWLNEIVAWLAGIPLLLMPTGYREFHYEHHRYTHIPNKDPELAVGGTKLAFWPIKVYEYMFLMSGIIVVIAKIGIIILLALGISKNQWEKKLPFVREKFHNRITWEARFYILIYAILIVSGIGYFPKILISLSIGLFLAHSILAFYLAAEHTGLPTEGDILSRSRSMKAYPIVRFFMWNMPYHVEHHAYPSVPFFALSDLHKAIESSLPHKENYFDLHLQVIKKLKWL